MAKTRALFHAPPGVVIKEMLDDRGWSQRDLAFILGCHEQVVNLLVSGKRGISPDMAKSLGAAFNEPADVFSDLQKSYDLLQARDPDPIISLRAQLQSYPIREMIRRGWLADSDAATLERQMARFFGDSTAERIPHFPHAGRKTRHDEIPAPQLAWLFRARQIARSIDIAKYSSSKLEAALPYLRRLLNDPEKTSRVSGILGECGVRFLFVESLPQGKIDGACFWLDPGSPVIGMSLRFDRIDNFWFVLRHEIEHVLQCHGQADEIGVLDELEGKGAAIDGSDLPLEERIANTSAAEFCIPQHEISEFIVRRDPYISERDVVAFAKRLDVHPGLVVGQIHSQTGRYNFLRRYLVKIRQFVLPGAITDGWGHIFPVVI
jgi:HTH-type transcriptional regulator/antitoxin HigA